MEKHVSCTSSLFHKESIKSMQCGYLLDAKFDSTFNEVLCLILLVQPQEDNLKNIKKIVVFFISV